VPEECLTCTQPPEAQTEVSAASLPSCSEFTAWPPDRLTKFLLKWFRYHFSNADLIVDPALKSRVWVDDINSPIHISTLAEYTPADDERRPAVLVERRDQQRLAELDVLGGTGGDYALVDSNVYIPMAGQTVVMCVGGREGESDAIAAELFGELSAFLPALQQTSLPEFKRVRLAGIGPRQQLPTFKDTWTTQIFLEYHYQMVYRVFPGATAPVREIYQALVAAVS